MREITLTRGYVALVDDDDFSSLSTFKWFAKQNRDLAVYAARSVGSRTIWMHRIIMDAPTGILVDHINGNGLDNRRSNLRLATHRENCQNRRQRRDSASRFKGVTFQNGHWRMSIKVDGKYTFREFLTESEAARA